MCRRSGCIWQARRTALAEDGGGTGRDRPAAALLGVRLGRRPGACPLPPRQSGDVAGARVLDFATGSGLVAIAAASPAAGSVEASDIDPWCAAAFELNSRLNDVDIALPGGGPHRHGRRLGRRSGRRRLLRPRPLPTAWSRGSAHLRPAAPWCSIGDPGRSYCPGHLMEALATCRVPVTRMLEDAEVKRTTVWRFRRSPRRSAIRLRPACAGDPRVAAVIRRSPSFPGTTCAAMRASARRLTATQPSVGR